MICKTEKQVWGTRFGCFMYLDQSTCSKRFSLLVKSQLNDSSQIQNQYTSYFQRIRILDATIFQVPNYLNSIYPGSGGCAQTAGIKIQLENDLYSGKFLNFQMEPGKKIRAQFFHFDMKQLKDLKSLLSIHERSLIGAPPHAHQLKRF